MLPTWKKFRVHDFDLLNVNNYIEEAIIMFKMGGFKQLQQLFPALAHLLWLQL